MSSSRSFHPRKSVDRLFVFLVAVWCLGCGSESPLNRKAVSGSVIVDGVPLAHGVIRLLPQAQASGPGVLAEITDGKFSFDTATGPVPGVHRVEIEATQHLRFEIDDEAAFAIEAQKTGRSPVASNPMPAVYNRNSTLSATIADTEEQSLSFELKSKPE